MKQLLVFPQDLKPFEQKDRELEDRIDALEMEGLIPEAVEGDVYITRITTRIEELPVHTHLSASQGGFFPWATITGFSTPSITLGGSASEGTSTRVIRADATIRAFDATMPTTLAVGDSPSTGTAAFAARRDHRHGMPPFGSPVPVTLTSSPGTSTALARADHVHALSQSITPTWVGAHRWEVYSMEAISVGPTAGSPTLRVDTTNRSTLVGYDADNWVRLSTTSDGVFVITPSGGSIALNIQKGDVSPTAPYSVDLGTPTMKFRSVHAAELWAETLVAQQTLATIGGRILVGPTTVLEKDITPQSTTIVTRHNNLVVNDIIYMESGGKVEFMRVTAGPVLVPSMDFRFTRNSQYLGVV